MLKYLELEGKVPKHSLEEFATSPRNYQDAAILLNNRVVVVDFDDFTDVGNKIYQMYPTLKVHTSRGFHLYYKKPKGLLIKNWTKKLTNIGIQVDYKTGKQAIGVVKQNGDMREMDNEELLDHVDKTKGDIPELPFELYPNKLKDLLYGMGNGDGRNSALYGHMLAVFEMYGRGKFDRDLTQEDLEELATWINKNVFKEPMDQRELETLLGSVKDKETNKPNKYLNKSDVVMTSEVLVDKLDIHYFRGKLFFRQNSHYISDDNLLLRAIDQLIQLKPSQHKQLIELFKVKAFLQKDEDLPVQFKNGFSLYDNEIVEINPGFTPFYFDVDYKEDAYDLHVDEFLDFFTCNRQDLRNVVEEIFGHIIMTKGFPHRSFFFWGEQGDNGKSTLIKMVQAFADGLQTNVPLDKFDDDTSAYSLVGKLLNVADDINASYLEKSSNFKTIASGDPVMLRPIYSPAVTLNNKATLIFTCNEIPVFKDKSGGIKKRMRIIPCDAKVTKRDMTIDEKLSSENAKSYILRLAIEGMERIIKQGDLSQSLAMEEITKQYFVQSDSVLNFLENYDVVGKETKKAYMQYTIYCDEEGLKAVGSTEFGRRIKKEGFGTKQVRKNNKRVRVFENEESLSQGLS